MFSKLKRSLRACPVECHPTRITSRKERGMSETCPACYTPFEEHIGLVGTCADLQNMRRIASELQAQLAAVTRERPETRSEDALTTETTQARVSGTLDPIVRLLPITACYQCHLRDTMTCVCHVTGKRHPPPGSIPMWCPLPNDQADRPAKAEERIDS